MDIKAAYKFNELLYDRVLHIIKLFYKHNDVPFRGVFIKGLFDTYPPIINHELRHDFDTNEVAVYVTASTDMHVTHPTPSTEYKIAFNFSDKLISSYTDAQLIEWYEDYCDKRNEEYYRNYCNEFIKTVTDNPELANKVLTLSTEDLKIYIDEYIETLKKMPFNT